jgi:hypothetical protein
VHGLRCRTVRIEASWCWIAGSGEPNNIGFLPSRPFHFPLVLGDSREDMQRIGHLPKRGLLTYGLDTPEIFRQAAEYGSVNVG